MTRQLRVIRGSRVDAIVLWADEAETAEILKEMRALGMKQRVFGSYRTLGPTLLAEAGNAAEGFEAVFPYDPTRNDQKWIDFNKRFEARFHEKPEQFASLAYDAMNALLDSICKAGLNRARIHDALADIEEYDGVTGHMVFDPNQKNVAPMYLGTVHNGAITYRVAKMDKTPLLPQIPAAPAASAAPQVPAPAASAAPQVPAPAASAAPQVPAPAASAALQVPAPAAPAAPQVPYARVGEDGVDYAGPHQADLAGPIRVVLFGPHAMDVAHSPDVRAELASRAANGKPWTLVPVASDQNWGAASTQLVHALKDEHALAIVALDRDSAHLAEQLALKAFVPVVALSSDKKLTSTNIPWIFRLPPETTPAAALRMLMAAESRSGANAERLRNVLASGETVAGVAFLQTGEPR